MKTVLIIEDDPATRFALARILRPCFLPIESASGCEGLKTAATEKPDIILLDLRMPDLDGFTVCRRLREQPSTRLIPIIMLTGEFETSSRVRGLREGADDYVIKPFQPEELIARIEARIRRQALEASAGGDIELAELKLLPMLNQAWLKGEQVRLTHLEFELLRYLIDKRDQVITRGRLLGDLWPDSVVTDRTIDTHIARLRRKLKGFSGSIETVYKAGYVLKSP